VDHEAAVRGICGVEGEGEQALFAAGRDPAAEIGNGVGRSAPSFTIRMAPPFSTMNRRARSPGGAVR
jgi:hypothetical protein